MYTSRSLLLVPLLFAAPSLASAATLTWDASAANPAAPTGGAGSWSTSAANWSNGVTDNAWNNSANDSAVFLGNLSSNATVTLGVPITVDSITFGSGGSANYTISGSGSNILTLTSGLVAANRSATIQATITGSNGLSKSGSASTLILFAANTYTGATTIQNGTIQTRSTGALPTTTTVVFGVAESANTATLDIRANQTVAGLAVAGTGVNTITNTQTNGTTTLTVNSDGAGLAAADSTFSGAIQDGDTARFLALTKSGSRTLTLTGANTYTGATTVNAGSLIINGSLASGSAVTVNSGGILGGNGNVAGSVSVLGALAAGQTAGPGIATLNTGALSIGSTGVLDIELGRSGSTPTADRVNVTGSVTLLSGANLKLTLAAGLDNPLDGDILWLITNDGSDAVNGVFTSLNGVATTLAQDSTFTWNGRQWQISYQADFATTSLTGGNDIALLAVPEPDALALAALGLLTLTLSLRSRRARGY